ncbi:hypothetical protein AAVH_12331 [Aphelenchoides avenae]|nr:hypothetical protein AAVH_12331 [Aphelenchus avenae]
MGESDDERLLDYEEDQEELVKKGLVPKTVASATSQLEGVTLNTKPAAKEVDMDDSTAPAEIA